MLCRSSGMTVPFDLVGEAAEVVQPVLRDPRLRAHLGVELAVLLRLDRRDAIGVLGDHVAPFHQQPPAPGRRQLAPRPGAERVGRRFDRAIDFSRSGEREGAPHAAGRRVECGESAAVRGGDVARRRCSSDTDSWRLRWNAKRASAPESREFRFLRASHFRVDHGMTPDILARLRRRARLDYFFVLNGNDGLVVPFIGS